MYNYLRLAIVIFLLISCVYIYFQTKIIKKFGEDLRQEKKIWKFGFLYFNPVDERLILPKNDHEHFSLNIAKPISVMVSIVIMTCLITYVIASTIQY